MSDTHAHATSATVQDLSLEEKASLLSGHTFWTTQPIEGAGVAELLLTDGPHGVRKQDGAADHLGIGESVPATCFPPAVGLGSSWDAPLVERVGVALGVEAAVAGIGVLLGPGVNIKRSPLCGRNFEYFSEDPTVSGVMGAAWVQGLQSQGVGASVKHFAANNQETDRMRCSSEVDERTLREIYLRAFQHVVEEAQPWTVMCSYNRINGVYAAQDPWLLTRVLRGEWGFGGVVVSDWGAVSDRLASLVAGMDLEMPTNGGRTDAQVVAAVRDGRLAEQDVDVAAQRVVSLVERASTPRASGVLDVDAHHALAREAASRSIVLLKNEDDVLPLRPEASVAVVGAFAQNPRYQGAGSSKINPTRLDNALDGIRQHARGDVDFAQGYVTSTRDTADPAELRAEAVSTAAQKDVAVVFLGLTEAAESEGYDREHLDLPDEQLELLDAVLEVNPNTVVVLSNGSVVALPFASRVPAVVEGWLLGQAGGSATADVLYGAVNPSGKLTETIPLRLQDTPAYLNFATEGRVHYGEGIFVGYRWYDARDLDVAYPFGHGLSYTTFAYENLTTTATEDGDVEVRVTVVNTGDRAGREGVQVYASLPDSVVQRPARELKAFAMVDLAAGASHEVVITVRRQDLAHWDLRAGRWLVEGGDHVIDAAASSRDIRASSTVAIDGDEITYPLTPESSLGEVMAHPVGGPMLAEAVGGMADALEGASTIMADGVDAWKMIASFPLDRIGMMAGDSFDPDLVQQLLIHANAPRSQS